MLNQARASNCVVLLSVRSEKSAPPGARAVTKWFYHRIVIPVGRNAAVRKSFCVLGCGVRPEIIQGARWISASDCYVTVAGTGLDWTELELSASDADWSSV